MIAAMIRITDTISIGDDELEESFVRASGPGGQNVNKLSTAVQLRFDVRRSPSLPNDVALRLMRLAGSRLTKEGVVVINGQRHRTQERRRARTPVRADPRGRRAADAAAADPPDPGLARAPPRIQEASRQHQGPTQRQAVARLGWQDARSPVLD